MKQFLRKFAVEDSGQDLIEYALVAALISLGAIVAIKGYSTKVGNAYNVIGTSLSTAL